MTKLADLTEVNFDYWTKKIPRNCFVDRDISIINKCKGKTILHVGAADAPFELEKGESGRLLHQRVQQVSKQIVGVDVNAGAVKALEEIGIRDILVADICSDHNILEGQKFDVILCCDVIEHVDGAGSLLASCRRYMHENSDLVVSTINATALKPAIRAFAGRESVHYDHVSYYSFATLGKLMTLSNLRPTQFGVFAYPTFNPVVGILTRRLMRAFPGTADGIIINARLQ